MACAYAAPTRARPGRVRWVGRSSAAHREEVERSVYALGTQRKVARRDRRREAVVERTRQPEPLVDRIPAEPERQLVETELAGVEHAQQLDASEHRPA